MNKRIAILLPYKEDYNKNNAGSASLWVKDFFENSKLKKITTIYGINTKKKSLSKNFVNLNNKFPLFTFKKNIYYAKLFLKNIHKQTKIIEIHNRPEIFHFINKQNSNYKLILVFHNNPLLIRGSKKIKERKNILNKCSNIIFVSKWVQKKFFEGLDSKKRKKCSVIYPAIKRLDKLPKKENIIKFKIKLKLPFFKSSSLFTCREKSPKLIMIIEKYANIVPATARIGAILFEFRRLLKSKIPTNALVVIFTSLNNTIKKKSNIPA